MMPEPGLGDLLFDKFHYAQVSGASGDARQLRRHFETFGAAAGLSPSPLFDRGWYAARYRDVAAQGGDVHAHFLTWGSAEKRSPSALFDAGWYAACRAAEGRPVEHPLLHYLTEGWRQGLDPHPLFWSQWYRQTWMAAMPEEEPLGHYLAEGAGRGLAPNPLFDAGYYAESQMRGADAGATAGADALAHFLAFAPGDPGLSPHPLFDGAHYLAGLARRGLAAPGGAYLHYMTQGAEAGLPAPHPLFDAAHFRRQTPATPVANAAGRGIALAEYVLQGAGSGADPHPLFSRRHYLDNAPDVRAAAAEPLAHYARFGETEARSFHPLFDIAHYRAQTGEPDTPCLRHYLEQGMAQGLTLRPIEAPDRLPRLARGLRRVLAVPLDGPLLADRPAPEPGATGAAKADIGLFAHVFHTDLAEEILEYANNAPRGRSRLFVTTDSAAKARVIEAACARIARHEWEIRVVPNRGRDIAPFLTGFRDRLAEMRFGLHIHSKKSGQHGDQGDAWRRHLLEGNLGSEALVANILDILSTEGIGAYAPDHFGPIRDLIQWGGNFHTARRLVQMMGHDLARDAGLDLPSGSFLWFRTEALAPLLALGLAPEHFEPERGQTDGTLAHAIERLFFHTVELAGLAHVAGQPTAGAPPRPRAEIARHGNRILPTPRDLGEARAYVPNCKGFLSLASEARRPRLNLLIPTADRARAYAGVATALDLFDAVLGALGSGWDARIVTTDAAPGTGFQPPSGFRLADPREGDGEGERLVLDASRREAFPLALRPGDRFLATAWWTAHLGHGLTGRQADLFGGPRARLHYLIQDFECGFHPWSTEWGLCEATYRRPETTVPIFNTELLAAHFREAGYFPDGHVLAPAISREFRQMLARGAPKERIVLLYARPHAERNCLPFLDMLVARLLGADPEGWRNWRFIAIGEDFAPEVLRCAGSRIEIAGRLTRADYAGLASRAALAVSLMVSPHPSYPPLEMAEAGVRVLSNRHGPRDPADLHENLISFPAFDLEDVAARLDAMARAFDADPGAGWRAAPKVNWFFGGRSNITELAANLATGLTGDAETAQPAGMAEAMAADRLSDSADAAPDAEKPQAGARGRPDREPDPPPPGVLRLTRRTG